MYQHNRPQIAAGRRLAAPMLSPVAGVPLVKSVPSLGRMLVWRKGRSTVDVDMPEDLKKRHTYEDFRKFVLWMEKEDGAHYRGEVKIHGPFPHFEERPNDIQVGERGATREVARSIIEDTAPSGKEDYVIEALFDVPEMINEIPTDLAIELFGDGKGGIRPLRENEWKREANRWSPRTA